MQENSIGQLFACDDVKIYPYTIDKCIAYNPRNNKTIKLNFIDVENFLSCGQFLTIDEHIEIILEKKPELKQKKKDIEKSLLRVLGAGLMVTPLDFINTLESTPEPPRNENNWKNGWALAVCSADRPLLVARLLTTIAPHLASLPKKPKLLIIDDSRNEESSLQVLNEIQKFSINHDLQYEFWNRKKRTDYCQKLSENLPNCNKSIHYLLDPAHHPEDSNTIGQARSFATIMANELPLLMIDDDCLINPLENLYGHLELSFGYSGRKGNVKLSYDELFISLKKSDVNPFYEHLESLGKSLQNLLQTDNSILLDTRYWKYKNRESIFEFNKNDFIGLTVNSIAGALNSRQMDWFYQLRDEDLQQAITLLNSLEGDEVQSLDQATWNGRSDNEIAKDIPFIGTTICGITPLSIIPPMPPVGRNEDLVLGVLINFLYCNNQTYQFGWGLPHLPEPRRQWQPFDEQQEPEFNSTSFFICLIHDLNEDCPYIEPEDRLRYLSAYLGSISNSEIKLLIKDVIYSHHSTAILQIQTSAAQCMEQARYMQGCEKMINYHLNQMKLIDDKLPQLQKDFIAMSQPFSKALGDWMTISAYIKQKRDNS